MPVTVCMCLAHNSTCMPSLHRTPAHGICLSYCAPPHPPIPLCCQPIYSSVITTTWGPTPFRYQITTAPTLSYGARHSGPHTPCARLRSFPSSTTRRPIPRGALLPSCGEPPRTLDIPYTTVSAPGSLPSLPSSPSTHSMPTRSAGPRSSSMVLGPAQQGTVAQLKASPLQPRGAQQQQRRHQGRGTGPGAKPRVRDAAVCH